MIKANIYKVITIIIMSLLILALCVGIGSVMISPAKELQIITHKLFGTQLDPRITQADVSIIWTIRMPRAILAFLTGGTLAVCGVVTQSVLQNPLASSYTLGVSSGAALGAAIITVCEISVPILGAFLLPAGGFAGGLITVAVVMVFARRFDGNISTHTIILMGMVVSMFTNAMLTFISVLSSEHEHKLIAWSMGSFNGKRWYHTGILFVTALIGVVILTGFHRELDILSFGDDKAMSLGVDASVVKRRLIVISALLTGISVCFTGTIGFVDLIAPHVTRRFFGASHRLVVPMSFFLGGMLMSISDLCARTLLSPLELPVGAVTALIGAPFFVWLYFRRH